MSKGLEIEVLNQLILDYYNKYKKAPSEINLLEEYPNIRGVKNSINRFGGIVKIREKLNIKPLRKLYDWEEYTHKIQLLTDNDIYFPTDNEIKNYSKDLFVETSHFKKKLGFKNFYEKIKKRPHRFRWTEKNIVNEIKNYMSKYGHFPNNNDLRLINRGDIEHAIYKIKGVEYYRKLFNEANINIALDGHICDSSYERFIDDILYKYNIKHELHCYPFNNHYKSDFLIKNIHVEIIGYDLKKHIEYAKRLKIKRKLYKKNKIKHIEFNYLEIGKVGFEKYFIEKLANNGIYPQLQKLPINVLQPSIHYWKIKTNFYNEIKRLSKIENGYFPTNKCIREHGGTNLEFALYNIYNGIEAVANKLNLTIKNYPKGYWNKEKVIMHYINIYKKEKGIPPAKIIKYKYGYLYSQIPKYGGMLNIREEALKRIIRK